MTKPFAELRVVELAGSHAGAFAAKIFADYGAEVVKVVPPDGDPLIHHGEALKSHVLGDGEIGSIWAYCNTSKQIIAGEPGSPEVRELVTRADVVIESSAPDPLVPTTAELEASRLVRVHLSPFGLSGPWSQRRSNVFTDDAASGHMYLNGEPHRHPFRRHGRHTEYAAGMYGFIGALAALIARESTGLGQTVEVSHIEAMVAMHQHTTTMWTHAGHILRRDGNAQPGMWHPAGVYECADGFVFLGHATGTKLEPFLQAGRNRPCVGGSPLCDQRVSRHKQASVRRSNPALADILHLGGDLRTGRGDLLPDGTRLEHARLPRRPPYGGARVLRPARSKRSATRSSLADRSAWARTTKVGIHGLRSRRRSRGSRTGVAGMFRRRMVRR